MALPKLGHISKLYAIFLLQFLGNLHFDSRRGTIILQEINKFLKGALT